MAASCNWTDSQVFKLIGVWGDEDIQEQLEGSKRNKHVYERMAKTLRVYGIEKSGEQCRTKVKKLRQEYKRIKDDHKETGNERKKWKFYDSINKIMGNRPSVTPPVVLDTLDSSTSSTEKITSEEETCGEIETEEKEISDEEEADNAPDKVVNLKCSSAKENGSVKGKKRRKRAKADVMEEVMTKTMKTVTDGFKDTEKMMVQLEEKQMEFEERMRKQDREFQMEMMRMIVSRLPSPNPSQYPMYQPYNGQPTQPGYFNHENTM